MVKRYRENYIFYIEQLAQKYILDSLNLGYSEHT